MRIPPLQRVAARTIAVLLGLVLASTLSSCSLFSTPPQPTSVSEVTSALRASLHITASVTDVTVTVAPRDEKDGGPLDNPRAWLISASVSARPDASGTRRLIAAIEEQLDSARLVAQATATLRLTGGDFPDASLDFYGSGSRLDAAKSADAVLRLRSLVGVQSVSVFLDGRQPSVTVTSAGQWANAATQLRTLEGFGAGNLASVAVNSPAPSGGENSISVDTATPDGATIAALAELVRLDGVTDLRYSSVRPPHSLNNWRPFVSVDTRSRRARTAVLHRLTRFDREAPPSRGIPRATFNLYWEGHGAGGAIVGYLGLPLGTAAPSDLVPAPATPSHPVDPAANARKLVADRELVRTLLDQAGSAAGIRGAPEIYATACDLGLTGHVSGTVLIPIFRITTRADDAYAAIVAQWEREGYTTEDHAAGTEIRTGGPLQLLTIEGTPDGLIVSATSRC